MLTIRKTLGAAILLGATGLALPMASTSAEALPGLDAAVMRPDGVGAPIDQVRWVCGPYRCHWAPNYYYGYGPGYGYGYGPRWGWGGRRHWRRW